MLSDLSEHLMRFLSRLPVLHPGHLQEVLRSKLREAMDGLAAADTGPATGPHVQAALSIWKRAVDPDPGLQPDVVGSLLHTQLELSIAFPNPIPPGVVATLAAWGVETRVPFQTDGFSVLSGPYPLGFLLTLEPLEALAVEVPQSCTALGPGGVP